MSLKRKIIYSLLKVATKIMDDETFIEKMLPGRDFKDGDMRKTELEIPERFEFN